MINFLKLKKSFGYAFRGIYYAFLENQNLKIHFFAAFLVILASVFFHVSHFEMGILGVMILLVISSEMINTVMEKIADIVKKEYSREVEIAKDVSAGMVLLIAIGSIIVGILIFLPYILNFFR